MQETPKKAVSVAIDSQETLPETANQDRYVVHLAVFEGPLDLLLHLIEKRQMEITTISLLEVTDQYLAYLHQWEKEMPPLANMASFVAVAARLLYIKSQSLLPQNPRTETAGESESATTMAEELQRHLQEYKLVKEIARTLKQREEAGLQTYSRSGLLAGIEAQLAWTPPTLVNMEISALTKTFQRLLEVSTRQNAQGQELLPVARVRVSECIATITARLQDQPTIFLSDIIAHQSSRIVIVVTFIAVLEMWKWEHIIVMQEDLMGPIRLERGPRWSEAGTREAEDI